ncbi:glutathione S-transferase T3 isoform X2 [Brassica napus]|uniref:glutathione S-transferase T3 isoform X2 n=2 Tax=Brassica napus TaxID=3708 RepID=UPI002078D916|nr:glutathione S-transferase T3 isoform X2 [Brassica napus]XP_048604477.1 glutathione S-transferase T3 isoform X2 [Brassica napus]XP_048604478.1 glutathione S-transferase T3 isoform X2 [Brassica napus]
MKAIEARPSSSLCLFIGRPSSSLSLHYFTLSFSFLNQKAVMDSPNPFTQSSGFLDLLTSQQCDPVSQNVAFGSSEVPFLSSQFTNDPTEAEETTEDRRGRKKWSRKEDVVLISAWLNTSKDPVTGNEQKAGSFWKRIGAYFNASPQLVGMADREVGNCKQRWSKISDQVSKFVGSLRAATSQQSSGQNDNDVMKLANEIYHHDYRAKFTLEHCWRELKYEQKWLATFGTDNSKSKRRKFEDGSQASVQSKSSHVDEEEARPEGVKKAKSRLKAQLSAKQMEATSSNTVEKLQGMLEIRKQDHELKMQDHELKKQDFEMKDKLNKQHMLEALLANKEHLSETEVALKNKLIIDMLS